MKSKELDQDLPLDIMTKVLELSSYIVTNDRSYLETVDRQQNEIARIVANLERYAKAIEGRNHE